MRISTCLATAVVVLGLAGAAGAQRPPGPGGPGGPGGMRNFDPAAREWRVLDQLGLNAAQKKKAKVLTDHFAAKAKAARAQMKPGQDFRAMREKFQPIREEYQKALGKVLTPAQMAQYSKIREEMRARFGGPGGPGRGGPGGPGGPGGRGGG